MRYLAIDYGDRRTGLAVCDANETIASPAGMLYGQNKLIERIIEIIEEQKADAVVIGLPINMDDTEGQAAKQIRQFGAKLKQHIDIEVFFHDERLSSFDAEQKLRAAELTRKKKKQKLDSIAAASILQSFLETKNTQ